MRSSARDRLSDKRGIADTRARRPPRRARWTLAALSGALLTVLYPPFSLSGIGWIALAPLLAALEDASPGVGFGLGWLSGAIGSLAVTGHWIYRAAHDYFDIAPVLAAGFTVVVTQVLGGVYFGLFGYAAARVGAHGRRWWLVPVLVVAVEYLRSRLAVGGPWELMGHSQRLPVLLQVCDVAGVYGLSFVLALSSAAVVELRRTWRPMAVAVAAVAALLGYGAWRLATVGAATTATLQVELVQGNLPNDERGRPDYFSAHLDRYVSLTRQAQAPPPALIVWPENAVGFFPAENPALLARMTSVAMEHGSALLAGAPRAAGERGVASLYNAAFLLTGDGIAATYDKRVLLPFVERLPLRPEDGPYRAGQAATVFSVPAVRFGVLICFEAIYPELARDLIRGGARLLVNISNDSWFDAGAGPEQHYEIARFRAVENRVSFVRVANSGISAVIDPSGREITRLPAHQAAAAVVSVPLGSGDSLYAEYGDVFALLCVAAAALALLLRRVGPLPP